MCRKRPPARPRFVPAATLLEDRSTPAAGGLDAAFNGTGTRVVPFDLGGSNSDTGAAVAVQADGKIVLVGTVDQATANDTDFAVTRLNPDGSLDATFGTGGRQVVAFDLGGQNSDRGNAVALQADGKIVVVGTVQSSAGDADFGVVRLNADGSPDATFGPGGKRTVAFDLGGGINNTDEANAVTVQTDGKIVVTGSALTNATGDFDFAVARLNADGGLDATFNTTGKQTVAFDRGGANTDEARAVAVQANGRIVLAGSASRDFANDSDFAVARLNADGGLDATFNATGKQTVAFDLGGINEDRASAVAVQADGKIVLGGSVQRAGAGDFDFAAARLNAGGGLDATFNTTGKQTVAFDLGGAAGQDADIVGGVVLQPDRKIVLAGYAQKSAASNDFAVARLLGDNESPVAVADAAATVAGTPVTINVLANDTDPNADRLGVTVVTAPANGTAAVNADGTVTYTPDAGFVGGNSFTYAAADSYGAFATATVSVTVTAATPPPGTNRPPVAVSDAATTGFGTPVVINVLANDSDPDGNPLTVAVAGQPANGVAAVNADGTVTFTPNAGFSGATSFTYGVSDGKGGTAAAAVSVTVQQRVFKPAAQFAVGLDRGGDGTVRLQNPDQSQRFAVAPFAGSGAAGVRTAAADFTGDGVADLVVGTGPGGPTRVRVLDGVSHPELLALEPFEAAFTGGVFVAAGDLNGDGVADLVITPDEGGGPRVRVFSGKGFGQLADFFGIDDPAFRGGARAAVADLSGDGVGDLIVSAGFGGGPRVAGFDGRSLGPVPVKLFADFLAFEPGLRNGVFVAGGDLNGDGFAELIAGGGPGGGPRVRALDGRSLLLTNAQVEAANFFAGDPANRGGVRLAAKDLDGDNRADIVAGAGPGGGSRVTAYAGLAVTPSGTPPELSAFDALPGFAGGVFVG